MKTMCSFPHSVKILERMDAEYVFYSSEAEKVFSYKITRDDCIAYNTPKKPSVSSNIESEFKSCKEVAAQFNKMLPLQADDITLVQSVICSPGTPKPSFNFRVELSIDQKSAKLLDFTADLKPKMAMGLCTHPMGNLLLSKVNVDYHIFAEDGAFVKSFGISKADCR